MTFNDPKVAPEVDATLNKLDGADNPLTAAAASLIRALRIEHRRLDHIADHRARDSMARLQWMVGEWMVAVFGNEIAMDPLERIMRFTEEAVELGQALGLSRDETVRVVDYVYGRPVGEPRQEVGGVMITLAALCFRTGIDLDGAALDEFARIDSPDMRRRIFEKQAAKRAQGLTSDSGFRAAGDAS